MDDIEFDAVNMVRVLLRSASMASLGTLAQDGSPQVSLATIATDTDGAILALFSSLAGHSRNLARDGRASLLLVGSGIETADPLAGARASFSGRFERIPRASGERQLSRFLARHPEADAYARFDDFTLYRLEPESVHLVAGFGRVVRLSGAEVLVPPEIATAFAMGEPEIVAHVNRECATVLARAATSLLGRSPTPWRAVAVDPDGIDVAGEVVSRLSFRRRANDPQEIPALLTELCDRPIAETRCLQVG